MEFFVTNWENDLDDFSLTDFSAETFTELKFELQSNKEFAREFMFRKMGADPND